MNYYISDTHFGHKNIINLDHRPFSDLVQMEQTMIMLWNAVVQPNDTVYILGDFCWGKAEEWCRILKQLKGQKVLIQGNHDLSSFPAELKKEFLDIKPFKEIVDNGRKGDAGRKVLLSHYPMLFYKRANNEKYYMLCGHVHTTAENDLLEKWSRELREGYQSGLTDHAANAGQIYNVGCMMPWMAYTPRTLDEIIQKKKEYVHKTKCQLW